MNLKHVLDDHSVLLTIVMDQQHPEEVREAVEGWLRPLRISQPKFWGETTSGGGIKVFIPAPQRLSQGKPRGKCLLVRPRHRDLLSLGLDQEAEQLADVVLDSDAGGETFQKILGLWLAEYLQKQGSTQQKVAQKNHRALERELRQAIKQIAADEGLLGAYMELFGRFLDVQGELLARPEWEMIEKDLETLARKLDKKKNWQLLKAGETPEGTPYYLGKLQGASLFVDHLHQEEGALPVVATYLVLHGLRRRLRQWEADHRETGPGQLVEEAFQAIPLPTLLIGPNDEVLQHNTAFVKLNLTPSKVKKLADHDQISTKGQIWSVRRLELASTQGVRLIFTLVPVGQNFSGSSVGAGQELGIITSSIAHELNNPLAGLLTALELMSLDDHWDEESLVALAEMKQGATRCKQLVDTFLGFSRMRAEASGAPDKDLLRRSTEQALHLQRFRMVESGLRLQLVHRQRHPFAYPLHAPSLTMAIYLVLGEYMTALHHLKLLERQAAHGLVIEGVVEEDADNFVVSFKEELPRPLGLSSKLLQYLLQQERLVIEERGSQFVFGHQNVLI